MCLLYFLAVKEYNYRKKAVFSRNHRFDDRKEENDMAIGILYESQEWSSYKLRDEIASQGIDATLIDMEADFDLEDLLCYKMVVNRVFASSQFRGHMKSLSRMEETLTFLEKNGIPVVNPKRAHSFEVSKALSTRTLGENGIKVPEVFGVFNKADIVKQNFKYPMIAKPDCGGRTNATYIIKNETELRKSMETAPDIMYIAEEYIEPVYGFLTRVEVIGDECVLILKRSVASNGLSAYQFGSTYAFYPECSDEIKQTAVQAMKILSIETGSMDIIETKNGFYIIDMNAVSNVSEDCTELFQIDLMKVTAQYIATQYAKRRKS